MSTIAINHINLELDLLDADTMEVYQTALEKATAAANEVAESGISVADSMRKQCEIVRTFVDEVFGKGIAEKCFPKKNNLGDHMKAFSMICQQANAATNEMRGIMTATAPETRLTNREQRRKQQYNNKKPSRYPAK